MRNTVRRTLRVQFYLRLASGERLVDAEEVLALSGVDCFHGFGWIGHVLIPLELPAAHTAGESNPQAHAGIALGWIESQHRYFVRKIARLHRHGIRTKWAKRTLFGTFVAMIVTLLALGDEAGARFVLGMSLERALTFVMGLSAVMLASWELHQNKMATRELLWQYRNQLKHFGRALAARAHVRPEPPARNPRRAREGLTDGELPLDHSSVSSRARASRPSLRCADVVRLSSIGNEPSV